jgi:hypothetical protein
MAAIHDVIRLKNYFLSFPFRRKFTAYNLNP